MTATALAEAPGPLPVAGRRTSSRRWLLVPLVLLLAAGVVLASNGRESDPLDEARAIVADDASFVTAIDAGAAMTRVSVVLQEAGEASCPLGDTGCDHLFAASAHTRVSAVSVLTCTRRGVMEARESLRRYLDALADDPTTTMPALPACAR